MSRFNFDALKKPTIVLQPILPKFTQNEVKALLANANYSQPDKMKEILAEELYSLDELTDIQKTSNENIFVMYFDPKNPESIDDVSKTMKMLADVDKTMHLDRNIAPIDKAHFIHSEIRFHNINANRKRLALFISLNNKVPIFHNEAWGYEIKTDLYKAKYSEKKEGGYENGF